MEKRFCDNCLKEVSCIYKEGTITEVINNKKITYLKKYYICCECNEMFYDNLLDYNVEIINKKLREVNNLITIDEIQSILDKYNIGKKPLSYVLGLGEVTITRYLDGQNPTKENSEFLKIILNNPNLYELYLIENKDKITDVAFKKSLGRTKQLQLTDEHSKIYNVALYIINKLGDITPLSLQKILYFVKGFSEPILKKSIFNDMPEAWPYGPVYKEIYHCFSYYKKNIIDYSEVLKDYSFNLSDMEKEYIDKLCLMFGCYSGSILIEMSHLTKPWIDARVGLEDNEPSSRLIEDNDINNYFNDICNKYNITNVDDISKYSNIMFNKALVNIRNK